jgi:hypothetical protein
MEEEATKREEGDGGTYGVDWATINDCVGSFYMTWSVSPAEMLRDWMEENGETPATMAERAGDPSTERLIRDIAAGIQPFSLMSTLLLIEEATGTKAEVWGHLGLMHELFIARSVVGPKVD